MKRSPGQLKQKRLLSQQVFNDTAKKRAEYERNKAGAAKIGTDADVRAYMLRMGYVVPAGTKP